MYGSFIVKFRNIGDNLEIDFSSIYFKEKFLEILDNLSNKFKINILNKRPDNIILREREEFFLRISYFEEAIFTKLSQELFKYKLLKLPLFQFEVLSFVSKSRWNKNFDEIDLNDEIILNFYTPYVSKIGDNFITDFIPYLFFNNIYKDENRNNELNLKKISNKIRIEAQELSEKKANFDINFGFGIKGVIKLDLNDLSYYDKEFIKTLLRIGYYKGVGYRKDLGYGMYFIEEINNENSNI